MDGAKVSEFVSRYQQLGDDELIDLCTRQNSMVPEAAFALESVLRSRNIQEDRLSKEMHDVLEERKPKPKPRYGLIAAQLLGAFIVITIASALAKNTPRWLGILLVLSIAIYWAVKRFKRAK